MPDGTRDTDAAGRVELIVIAPEPWAPTSTPERITAITARGIEGDRHCLPPEGGNPKRNITLIERASFDHLESLGIGVGDEELRRNVIVSGIALNPLVGRKFEVGGVRCRGTELCEPCSAIERATKPGVLKALVGRGGIRAEILEGGSIAIGDRIAPLD